MLNIIKKISEIEDSYTAYDISIELDSKKIGYAELFVITEHSEYGEDFDENYAYVKSIEINNEHRNLGYGSKVLTDLAAEFGGIYLCPDNENAERLYRRLGTETSAPDCLESETDNYGIMYYIA